MAKQQEPLDFGPNFSKYLNNVERNWARTVEIHLVSEDEKLQKAAYDAEYGASGIEEQPWMRAAMDNLRGEMKEILKRDGIDAVEDRAKTLVNQAIRNHILDPELAEEMVNAVRVVIKESTE